MISRMLYFINLSLGIVIICIASIVMKLAYHEWLLIVLGAAFIISLFAHFKYPQFSLFLNPIEFLLLFLFHLTSSLDWSFFLYILLFCRVAYLKKNIIHSILVGMMIVSLYTVARVSYTPDSYYNLLALGTSILTSFSVILIIQYIIAKEKEKNLLQKEMLYQEEKMNTLRELSAGLAHEIRNPLTTIKGFLQLSESHDYNIKQWYDILLTEVDRMNELTGDFLTITKPNTLSFKIYPINDCLQRVISLTMSEAKLRGHALFFKEAKPEMKVFIDMDKMVQVFVNLLKNAMEAMPTKGKVSISLSQQKNKAIIKLSDTGNGMTSDELSQLFDPFYTTKSNGTGLGLSISRKIIEEHGGAISVSSNVGQGTTVQISLPLADASLRNKILSSIKGEKAK